MSSLRERAEAGREASERLQEERLRAIEKAGGTFTRIAGELCAIAFCSIRNYLTVGPDGSVQLRDLDTVRPKKALKAIRSINQTKKTYAQQGEPVVDTKTGFQLWDKRKPCGGSWS